MTAVDHLILTRFNLPTRGPESIVRAREGWLRNRVELFERHTVATLRRQTVTDFEWVIYFDPESPQWLIDRLAPLAQEGLFIPLYREEVGWRDVVADARVVFEERGDLLLTTNLDNDDAVAVDFVERLQDSARRNPTKAIYLREGLILQGESLYLRDDPENAFCSVSESWANPITAWRDWHTLLRNHLPVVSESGPPAWLQVVHGQNVSNRIRGQRTDPSRHADSFPGQLDGVLPPTTAQLARDWLVDRPMREARDWILRFGKDVVLSLFGKATVDSIKVRTRAFRSRKSR